MTPGGVDGCVVAVNYGKWNISSGRPHGTSRIRIVLTGVTAMPRKWLRNLLLFILLLPSAALAGEFTDDLPDDRPDPDANEKPLPLAMPETAPALDPLQVKFLRERAEDGDASMQCLYGLALLNGSAGVTDLGEGMEWLRKSAEAGDERGGFEYGKMLYQGISGKPNQQESLKWLLPAAERGVNEAAYYAGVALLAGEDVEHDTEEGEKWLRRAAEAGIGNARADLGLAYYAGAGGVRQDYPEARRWFTLAAKQGNGDACNKLGVMYRNGYGVTADPERAILWFVMGAALGDQFAQFNLANSYMNGEWVTRDYSQAARWHEQAALRGNADAQYFLGCFYAEGIGVKRDPGRAREWLTQAERNGNEAAGELLEKLYEVDDSEELTVATDREPARVRAAALLREFVLSPVPAVDKGREVIMELEDDVEVTPDADGAFYLTTPGCPGVIYCEGADADTAAAIKPGMVIHGYGAGFSGLPGFLRLTEVTEAKPEDISPAEEKNGTENDADNEKSPSD